MAVDRSSLIERLDALTHHWLESAHRRRKDADSEADKVWSARQYGLTDTEEDAADEIQKYLANSKQAADVNIESLMARWSVLANEVMTLATNDENRLTAAYRRAGHEAYLRLIEELREAVTSTHFRRFESRDD